MLVDTSKEYHHRSSMEEKPCWYQVSSEDRIVHPNNPKLMPERMHPKKIITLKAGHASLASQPAEVTKFILEAVEYTG